MLPFHFAILLSTWDTLLVVRRCWCKCLWAKKQFINSWVTVLKVSTLPNTARHWSHLWLQQKNLTCWAWRGSTQQDLSWGCFTYFLDHKWEQRGDRFQDAQFGAILNTSIQKQINKSSSGCSEEFFRTAFVVYPYCFPSPQCFSLHLYS